MTVPVKPTETLTWAESGPPSPPGSTTPTEPSTGRKDTGYGFEEPLPHSEFNWLFRTLNRWMNWVTEKMDLHVHDGGTDPESVPKIDLKDHIDYGANGFLEVVQDDVLGHVIEHKGVGSAETGIIATYFYAEAFASTDPLVSPEVWGNLIVKLANGTSPGVLTSRTTPKAMAKIRGNTRVNLSPLTYDFLYGFDDTEAQGPTAGTYKLRLSQAVPSQNLGVLVVSPTNNGGVGAAIYATVSYDLASLTVMTVRVYDNTNTLVDNDFVVQVYY